jgi:membrane-bound inhibitor of C-type lysozyme
LEKVKAVQKTAEEIMGEVGVKNSAGLKMETTKVKLKNQRKVLHAFLLNGKGKAIELNAADQRIVAEEKEITTQGESMKSAHGGEIKAIPVQEIVDKKFVRIVPKNKYILFKRLSSASGAVVIK